MKKSMKFPVIFALSSFCVFMLFSCIDPVQDDESIFLVSRVPDMAEPEGSVVSAMNENVVISFPPGAVDKAVKIFVDECDNFNNCPFVTKMIRIDPFIVFNEPVNVRLNCNGDLLLGYDPPDGNCPLVICYWENEEEYRDRVRAKCINCCMDPESGTLNFSITQTGVFAVGIRDKVNFY